MLLKCEEAERYTCGRTKALFIVREIAAYAEIPLLDAQSRRFFLSPWTAGTIGIYRFTVSLRHISLETSSQKPPLFWDNTKGSDGHKTGNLVLDEMKSRTLPVENLLAM